MPVTTAKHSLKYHGRCICAQHAERPRWFAATNALNIANEIQLLEVDARSQQLRSVEAYDHQHEIWCMVAHPLDPSSICTAFSSGGKFSTGIWNLPEQGRELNQRQTLSSNDDRVVSLDWNQDGLAVVTTVGIQSLDLESGQAVDLASCDSQDKFSAGCWGSAGSSTFVAGGSAELQVWDVRSHSKSLHIDKPHIGTLRDVDCSSASVPLIATGGDDSYVRVWDLRNFTEPVASYVHHSHTVWQTRFNPKHPQLLAASSSDAQVSLINLGDLGRPKAKAHSRNPSGFAKGAKTKLGAVESFGHGDSVYGIAWGSADEWSIASVAYDGQVAVNTVPGNVKYSILL